MNLALSLALALVLAVPARAQKLDAAVPAELRAPLAGDPLQARIRRLPNGLTVYLSRNPEVPRITAWIAVRVGSKNDPSTNTGLAHYLEHMLFKGTSKLGTLDYQKERPHLEKILELYEKRFNSKDEAERAEIYKKIDAENIAAAQVAVPNEFDKIYHRMGFRGLNAFTSDEETVYTVDMPANRLETWARVEAQRFADPVFRLFQSELEAVYEEKNRSLDNAERLISEAHNRALYKEHPYGTQPTLGTIEHLKNPSLKRVWDFYQQNYVPGNMAIALSGDFDPDAAFALIERHFGAWPKAGPPRQPSFPLPKPKGAEKVEVRYEAEEKVQISWLTAPHLHEDADALAVLDMLADNSAAGLINLRLNQAQRVKAAGSFPSFYNDAGDWTVWAVTKRGQTPEQAEALLLETVEALKNGEFSEEDIKAVITSFEISEKQRLESNEGRAGMMATSFVRYEPWPRAAARLERLRKVTKADVLRVAKAYLGADRVVSYRRAGKPELPTITKPKFTDVAIDDARQSAWAAELFASTVTPITPRWLEDGRDYRIVETNRGRLFAGKNPMNDLFTLTLNWDRGSRDVKELCEAFALLELSGAGELSAEELKKKLFAMGTTVGYSCSERESSASISGLESRLWDSLELLHERFARPKVDAETLKKLVDVTIGAHQDTKKNPDSVHDALGQFARRGKESAVLLELSDAELQKLDLAKLKALISDIPNHRARLGYVGMKTAEEVAGRFSDKRKYKPVPAPRPIAFQKPKEDRVLFTHRDMVQARVGVFAADEAVDPARAVDYNFLHTYLGGGMSSLIFQEIREARALAYSAWGGYAPGSNKKDENQIYGGLGCQADKTVEAAKLLRSLLQKPPLTEGRFHEAARSIEENYRANPVRFRNVPNALMAWEDQGIQGDPRPARFERSLRYSLGDLKAFASRFEGRPMTTYVLGHRDRVGLDGLKALGKFEEKLLEDVFPY